MSVVLSLYCKVIGRKRKGREIGLVNDSCAWWVIKISYHLVLTVETQNLLLSISTWWGWPVKNPFFEKNDDILSFTWGLQKNTWLTYFIKNRMAIWGRGWGGAPVRLKGQGRLWDYRTNLSLQVSGLFFPAIVHTGLKGQTTGQLSALELYKKQLQYRILTMRRVLSFSSDAY